ncbi:unnamed protein product [Trifolium pratense]|uniref:Uncharacterized protein n=1 Tax=Trifolium pratense TaxID=57577 RepID=A0ACB0IIX5_TRIPR|nr:unnamed protein product [Trifolium pratense]
MENIQHYRNIFKQRRLFRKEKLRIKRLKPRAMVEKISIRRGLHRSKAGIAYLRKKHLESGVGSSRSEQFFQYEFSNIELFRSSEVQEYSDIGDMDIVCPKCGALIWYEERAEKHRGKAVLKISMCCKKGKVTIPYMKEPPPLLRSLFNGSHPKSSGFLFNIRSYNNMFSFTSLGGKIDSGADDGAGPPRFVISGQNYHRIGSLVPSDGQPPKFAQLYIYDTQNEVYNRLSHFSSIGPQHPIEPQLVEEILGVLDNHNKLVQGFRMVRDYIQSGQSVPVSLRLFRNRQHDPRTYNMPQLDEVAALVVGDIGDGEEGRDIVVRERDGHLRRDPAVIRLTFHEEGKQSVIFKDSSNLSSVLRYNMNKETMFLAWMTANKRYSEGRHLTYSQFPSMFTYDSDGRFWKLRQRGSSVGRLSFIPHSSRDLFYLRLLLNVQVGCTSYEDLRTVNGHVYDSYRGACAALRLLEDDGEFIAAINEVAVLGSGVSLRQMFANLLMSNTMSDPLHVWEQLSDVLMDGILFQRRRVLNDPGKFF